jgi:two-component system response regulator FixJ
VERLEPTVYVVDDDAAVRDSLAVLLRSAGFRSETFASAEDFLARFRPDRPGCLVLDVRLDGMDGLELQRRLNAGEIGIPIIFISGHGTVHTAVRTMQAGAMTFLEKPFAQNALLEHVRSALAHDAEVRAAEARRRDARARLATLTQRERAILEQVLAGRINKEIAGELGLATRTVEVHRARLMQKMGAESAAELVRKALETGLFTSHKPTHQ